MALFIACCATVCVFPDFLLKKIFDYIDLWHNQLDETALRILEFVDAANFCSAFQTIFLRQRSCEILSSYDLFFL